MVYGTHYEDASFSAAVNICENCRQTCETLVRVPEFDYMGCEACMLDALDAIERERREAAEAA